MTDWDNLEGEELNVALAKVAGYAPVEGSNHFWWVPFPRFGRLPDYASSIDAQKRDLEPLLKGIAWQWCEDHAVLESDGWPTFVEADGPEPLARARCMGKALEARP